MSTANKLTLLRIALVPFFLVFLAIDSVVLFSLASVTDYYDGKFARQEMKVTSFGKLFDPIADKLLVSSALLSFIAIRELFISPWVIIVIISREYIVSGLRQMAALEGVPMAAMLSGKVKTGFQIFAIITVLMILLFHTYMRSFFGITMAGGGFRQAFPDYFYMTLRHGPAILMWISAAISVYSGVQYLYMGRRWLNIEK